MLLKRKRLFAIGVDSNIETNANINSYWTQRATSHEGGWCERQSWRFAGFGDAGEVGVPLSDYTIDGINGVFTRKEFRAGRAKRGCGILLETHLDRCKPDGNNAAVTCVATPGTGDDLKVWSPAKLENIRWRVGEMANKIANDDRVTYVISWNEADGNPNRSCAVGTPGQVVDNFINGSAINENVFVDRLISIMRTMWSELKTPQRKYNTQIRDNLMVVCGSLTDNAKRVTKGAWLATTYYTLFNRNNGEILNYCNGCSFHSYDLPPSLQWTLTNPGAGNVSLWHFWTALQQGQALAGTGQRHFAVLNEGGPNERMMTTPLQTAWNDAITNQANARDNQRESWDTINAPAHAALLPARRREKVWRLGALIHMLMAYGTTLCSFYSASGSPHDSMVLLPDYENNTPREPTFSAFKYLWDLETYRLYGNGPWALTLKAKPYCDTTKVATVGYHDPHDGIILSTFSATKANPMSTNRPWYEWDRATFENNKLTFTAPVTNNGLQVNTCGWLRVLPVCGTYKVAVAFLGNAGTVRLRAVGYDKLNGLVNQVASSTATNGVLTIQFTGRGPNNPNAPDVPCVVVHVESTAAAVFNAPILWMAGTPDPIIVSDPGDTGGGGGGGGGAFCTSTTDVFLNPIGKTYGLHRPTGDGRTLISTNDVWIDYWNKFSGANLNRPTTGWGCGIWDCRSTANTQQVTVQWDGVYSSAQSQFPVTLRVPTGFGESFNGPNGTDQTGLFLQADGKFHDLWKFKLVGGVWKAGVHYSHAANSSGGGWSSSASGMYHDVMTVRYHEWSNGGKCEHALGLALQGGNAGNAQLGRTFQWPAQSGDGSASTQPADGIKYGSWWVMPRPGAEGGPDPNSLGLGTKGSLAWAVYEQARDYGWVICDKSGGPSFRGDQNIDAAFVTAFQAAVHKVWQYMRAISNVGTSGSDPIGGGTPLALNCAFDRDVIKVPDIKPASYWEAQGNAGLSSDLSLGNPLSTSDDSVDYYTLAYYMNGHVAMYRATGLTKYLDRALLYTNNVIGKATTQAGGYLGWKSPSNGNQETSLYECYFWRYVCQMLDVMADAGVTGTYLTQYNSILAFTERNIWTKWYSRGSGNIYRSVAHICSHWATISDFLVRRSANANIVVQATTVRANIDHVGMASWNNDSLRSIMVNHPNNSSAYFWHAYFPKVAGGGTAPGIPSSDTNWGSDTSHGCDVLSWIVEAYDMHYGPWVAADITKFTILFNSVIWPSPSTGTNFTYLIGSGDTELSLKNTGWLKLGRYSEVLQKRLETLDHSKNIGLWGNLAYNAAVLLGTVAIPRRTDPGVVTLSDPNATAEAKALWSYLNGLKSKTSNKVLSGQRWLDYCNTINTATGKYPAILNLGISNTQDGTFENFAADAAGRQNEMLNWWNAGGVVIFDLFLRSPVSKGPLTTNGTVPIINQTQMIQSRTTGTAYNDNLKFMLDKYVSILLWLQARGVPVIVRHMVEHNGSGFWYLDNPDLINFYRYCRQYIIDKGVHNALWSHCPSNYGGSNVNGPADDPHQYMVFYPGDDVIDIVAFDLYVALENRAFNAADFEVYTKVHGDKPNKPIMCFEMGVKTDYNSTTKVDLMKIINGIKAYAPDCISWFCWSVVWSMRPADNNNVAGLLGDSWVITRDETGLG